MARPADLALIERFPALRRFPRARLGQFPSPVVPADVLATGLWLKREDLNAER